MERNLKRIISYGLAIFILIALLTLISACSSSQSSTPAESTVAAPSASPTPEPSTSPVTANTTNSSPTPSVTPSPTPTGPPPVITNSTLPDGKVGTPYSQSMEATGGSGSYSWSISADILPVGLTLNPATGAIGGTPEAAATYFFDVTVTDSKSGATADKAFSITVDLNPSATPPPAPTPTSTPTPTPTPTSSTIPTATTTGVFTITTTSLPAGIMDASYSQILQVSGGTGPYTWSYWLGDLPDGLKLDGRAGIIYGIPTAHGTFKFTVEAKDSNGTIAAEAFTMTVNTQ